MVNLTLEAMQLKAGSFEVRGSLTQYEAWGLSEKRVRKVLREPVCSCSKECYKQLDFEQLNGLSEWFHGYLTHSERQYVIFNLCQAATGNNEEDSMKEDTLQCRVQWQLQGGA